MQAAVQLTGFTVQSFTVREQIIFVRTLAKYLGVANDDVEIVSVKDVMITFRDEIRRVPSPFPLRDLASRRLGQESPGQQLLQQRVQEQQQRGGSSSSTPQQQCLLLHLALEQDYRTQTLRLGFLLL